MKHVPKELRETADISRGRPAFEDRLKFIVTVTVVLVGGYIALGWIAEAVALSIPNDVEARYFSMTVGEAESTDPRFVEAKAIFEKLEEDEAIRPLPYRLFFLDVPEPNAFAVPGGGVGVTAGLLDLLHTERGMAMVLGHELGHHARRHVLRAMGRQLLQQAVVSALFGNSGVGAMEAAATVAGRQYSQAAEYEADEFGFELVGRVYGTTDGALEFFEWVCNQEWDASETAAWVRTHPLGEKRIERMLKMGGELSGRGCPLE